MGVYLEILQKKNAMEERSRYPYLKKKKKKRKTGLKVHAIISNNISLAKLDNSSAFPSSFLAVIPFDKHEDHISH